MKKLLLIIDYQNDYVAEDGQLSIGKPAQAIEKALLRRIKAYQTAGHDVLCTLDTHPSEGWSGQEPESRLLALHCLEDSDGWQLYGKLAELDLETLTKASYTLDQADIDWLVRQYDAIELAGVAAEIGVLQNAIVLYNHAANQGLGVTFALSADCVAALDPAGQAVTMEYLQKNLGFIIQ
jgi:nicotinamidase-related amidase